MDKEENPRNWLHPANKLSFRNTKDDGSTSRTSVKLKKEWEQR
jgi:hypothetical protein